MLVFKNAMDVFKLLEKSNCRKCNEKTCLAFASKVFLGQKPLDLCPCLSQEVLDQYQEKQNSSNRSALYGDRMLADLKSQMNTCDLQAAAKRVGGVFANSKLTIRIFGKPFSISSNGTMYSDIHINHFIATPVLEYVLQCKGVPLTHNWIPFRELKGGLEMNGLFVQQSEKPLKKIADGYPNLFEDLMTIFSGKEVENGSDADISLALYPLPKLPILISYWKPEEGMESDLHIFFDSSAEMNANLNVIYLLSAGIVKMFGKISITHGVN
jgi:hypothetical protein